MQVLFFIFLIFYISLSYPNYQLYYFRQLAYNVFITYAAYYLQRNGVCFERTKKNYTQPVYYAAYSFGFSCCHRCRHDSSYASCVVCRQAYNAFYRQPVYCYHLCVRNRTCNFKYLYPLEFIRKNSNPDTYTAGRSWNSLFFYRYNGYIWKKNNSKRQDAA